MEWQHAIRERGKEQETADGGEHGNRSQRVFGDAEGCDDELRREQETERRALIEVERLRELCWRAMHDIERQHCLVDPQRRIPQKHGHAQQATGHDGHDNQPRDQRSC
jgi:hypothetical protein